MIKVKICTNPKCKDNYQYYLTKWQMSSKDCPTCKSKLKVKKIIPATITLSIGHK